MRARVIYALRLLKRWSPQDASHVRSMRLRVNRSFTFVVNVSIIDRALGLGYDDNGVFDTRIECNFCKEQRTATDNLI